MIYSSKCAQEAQAQSYGNSYYWNYLDKSSQDHRAYFLRRNDAERAESMMTRSLAETLMGNDGE